MKHVLTLLAVALTVSSCAGQAEPPPQVVYVGAAIETPDQLELTQAVVDEIARRLNDRDILTLDVIALEEVLPQYSSNVSRIQVRDTLAALTLTASDEQALIKAVTRIAATCKENKDLPVRAFLISEGSTNQDVLNSIKNIANQMQECTNLNLFLVGLSSKASIPTSAAFTPIRDRIRSARGNQEWEPFAKSL